MPPQDLQAKPTPKANPDNPLGHAVNGEIPVFQPHIGLDTIKAVTDALTVGWLGMGSFTKEFEEGIAAYLGLRNRYVVATNTGTSALHLALMSANIGPGDEVIVPSFNFVADHQAIHAVGAHPVLCDIRESDLGIDCAKAEKLITAKTKAIMPLHYAGIPCDLDGVYALAKRHKLRVIEDATHAFGTHHKGKMIGSFGDITCFSFDPVKVITSIDGGAIVFNDESEVQRLHEFRLLGINRDTVERYKNSRVWEYDVVSMGYRYHLSNINANIGLSQLSRANEFIGSRQESCKSYQKFLKGTDGLVLPNSNYQDISPFIYFVRVLGNRRNELAWALKREGIATGVHFIRTHEFTYFKNAKRGDLSVTDQVTEEVLTLPLHTFMRTELIERIATSIRTILPTLPVKTPVAAAS